jgi:hypothetical protein
MKNSNAYCLFVDLENKKIKSMHFLRYQEVGKKSVTGNVLIEDVDLELNGDENKEDVNDKISIKVSNKLGELMGYTEYGAVFLICSDESFFDGYRMVGDFIKKTGRKFICISDKEISNEFDGDKVIEYIDKKIHEIEGSVND